MHPTQWVLDFTLFSIGLSFSLFMLTAAVELAIDIKERVYG